MSNGEWLSDSPEGRRPSASDSPTAERSLRSEARQRCIFCDIVAGQAPARVVHDDERTLAFLDIFPITRGHTLVVPKAHARDLLDADPDDVAAVARTAQLVAAGLRDAVAPEGLNLLLTNGAAAMQKVFHLHVHVLPRWTGDSLRVSFDRKPGDPDDLDVVAEELRDALDRRR